MNFRSEATVARMSEATSGDLGQTRYIRLGFGFAQPGYEAV
jgi:hypothetical protein